MKHSFCYDVDFCLFDYACMGRLKYTFGVRNKTPISALPQKSDYHSLRKNKKHITIIFNAPLVIYVQSLILYFTI